MSRKEKGTWLADNRYLISAVVTTAIVNAINRNYSSQSSETNWGIAKES